ncbi:hypothetical protein ACS0TY_033422 [Phlomoides rotata]
MSRSGELWTRSYVRLGQMCKLLGGSSETGELVRARPLHGRHAVGSGEVGQAWLLYGQGPTRYLEDVDLNGCDMCVSLTRLCELERETPMSSAFTSEVGELGRCAGGLRQGYAAPVAMGEVPDASGCYMARCREFQRERTCRERW